MSIQSEITRITNNVQDTIDLIEQTGVSVPAGANSDNLPLLAQALANEKQDKLTGTQGQFVGFTADNVVGAVDAPAGLPTGGTTGQILYQGESGPEWGDNNAITATGGGAVTMGENIGSGPYQIEMTDEDEDTTTETWTFFLADGTQVNKTVLLVG